jgi:hypothetical protein
MTQQLLHQQDYCCLFVLQYSTSSTTTITTSTTNKNLIWSLLVRFLLVFLFLLQKKTAGEALRSEDPLYLSFHYNVSTGSARAVKIIGYSRYIYD